MTVAIVSLVVSASNCGRSKPYRFYLLSAESVSSDLGMRRDFSIGVGPIEFPEYLDRPQIVARTSGNRLLLADQDRWAEPLEENFARVLVENLSALLSTDNVVRHPWPRPTEVDYQVVVTVTRFDLAMDREVVLHARWAVIKPGAGILVPTRTSRISESVSQSDYDSAVQAASRTVDQLGREIAASLSEIVQR